MAQTYDLILKGGTVVNHDGEGMRDIGIRGGRFAAIGDLALASAGDVVDCRGLHLLPGVIDSHVHFREPGLTHKEDLETGSLSAVMGGVTAVFEMPNTDPLTVTAQAVADKVKRGHHRMHCDFAFYVGATRENTKDLAELERLPGVAAVKVFMGSSTGSLLVEDDEGVRAILKVISRRAAFHSEDEYRLRERMNLRVEGDPRSHPVWRDATAALMATKRLIALAHETGKRVHVLHVTSMEEAVFLADHKDVASAEATPAHLTLAAPDCYERLGTLAQLNPPIREAPTATLYGLAWRKASSTASARIIRRIPAQRKRSSIRSRIPACPECRRWFPSCSTTSMPAGCRCFALSISPAPARPGCMGLPPRAASRKATTPM